MSHEYKIWFWNILPHQKTWINAHLNQHILRRKMLHKTDNSSNILIVGLEMNKDSIL